MENESWRSYWPQGSPDRISVLRTGAKDLGWTLLEDEGEVKSPLKYCVARHITLSPKPGIFPSLVGLK